MKSSLLSLGSLLGLPKSFLVFLLSLISMNTDPSNLSALSKAASNSSLVVVVITSLYPHASAILLKFTSNPIVGCPPTESCDPLLSKICLKFGIFLVPICAAAPMCIKNAPSPSKQYTFLLGLAIAIPIAILEACPMDPTQ